MAIVEICACVLSHFSCVQLCDSMDYSLPGSSVQESSRQEYESGLPCPPPGDLADPEVEDMSLKSPALAGGLCHLGNANFVIA